MNLNHPFQFIFRFLTKGKFICRNMDIFMHNIAFSAKEIDVGIVLTEKLHRPPLPIDPPLNFHVHLSKKGCGILTLPTQEVGDAFLLTYGHTSIKVKGRRIKLRLSDKPVNEGCIRHILSIPWGDPGVLETRIRQRVEDSQPIELQGYAFGHFRRDGSFLVDSDTLGNGNISCDLDLWQLRHTVQQRPLQATSAAINLGFESDLSSLFTSLFSTTFNSRKFASYTPSQLKTVIATDSSQTQCLVVLDSDTSPIFECQLPNINISAVPGSQDKQSSPPGSQSDAGCWSQPGCIPAGEDSVILAALNDI